MQIRRLVIHRFRGIESLNWSPKTSLCCLIGSGDTRKTTVLDAIEAALSTRWIRFSETDFFECDTSSPFTIDITIGELSPSLLSDERFGLSIGGWTSDGELNEEPEGDDEPVLTVRLVVDSTLEPVWSLVCERSSDIRNLSNRDRLQFGCIRLAGDDARHLAWGQGSILSRLTGDKEEAAVRLADAYGAARESANLHEIESLSSAASTAEKYSREMGAYISESYIPGLELGRSGLSSGAISLHDGKAPLRLAGLGTRRLVTLAMQRSTISEGAIVIIDEIELGLEPHRIIGAISQLKTHQKSAQDGSEAVGHIIMTTHSDIVLGECGAENLLVCQLDKSNYSVSLKQPQFPNPINSLMRHMPRALFARRILVSEGFTEVGLLLGLRECWTQRHNNIPIEQLGAAIANGNGEEAVAMSVALSNLGFPVALFRDSDKGLKDDEKTALTSAGINVIEYEESMHTETAIFLAASDEQVQSLLVSARNEHGDESVNGSILAQVSGLDHHSVLSPFSGWSQCSTDSGEELRRKLGEIAHRKKWIKDSRISRDIAPLVYSISQNGDGAESHFATTLNDIETWLYE